jgi:hypothetical protein
MVSLRAARVAFVVIDLTFMGAVACGGWWASAHFAKHHHPVGAAVIAVCTLGALLITAAISAGFYAMSTD